MAAAGAEDAWPLQLVTAPTTRRHTRETYNCSRELFRELQSLLSGVSEASIY